MGQQINQIEVKDVSIEFPGVKALKNVNCSFRGGEVMAIVGANGAGKSTLMKVLSGANPTYTGHLFFNGQEVEIRNPRKAKELGIGIVYQEVDSILIPNLSVAENIMIDHIIYDLKGIGRVDWRNINKKAKQILDELGININVNALVSTLTLAQKQMVVIGRSILQNCKFLILDEPTAPLSDTETKTLFELIRRLKSRGVGIIFISHRLNELFEICDKIIAMRDGEITGNCEVNADLRIEDIVKMMLGKTTDARLDKSGRTIGEPVLKLSNFGDRYNKVHDINMELRKGEIIGLAGLVGAGKTELCKAIFGVYGKTNGVEEIKGRQVHIANPTQAIRNGLALIPEERRKEGVNIYTDIVENIAIVKDNMSTKQMLNRPSEEKDAKEQIDELNIKTPSAHQIVANLSGGNQQKVVIGKWLNYDADIYIFDEPTKGIDVGAKQEIYKLIVKLARKGKSIIYTTSEQSEIMILSDRIYVMYDGTIQKELDPAKTNDQEILFYSTGGKR